MDRKHKFIVGQLVHIKPSCRICIVTEILDTKGPIRYCIAEHPSGEHIGWFTASKLRNVLSTSEILTGKLYERPYY